ncbi:MAG: putative quinol monooxygenase [Novosphingobium sp.]
MAKILISAQIDVEPAGREQALKSAQPWIDGALAQPGCLHYDWSADLNNSSRINVFEEWESEDALAAHFAGPQYAGMLAHIGQSGLQGAVSRKYRVDAESAVYGADGKPTPEFD